MITGLLLCCNLMGQACQDCLLIRGDANCDGVVNLTDVIVDANGTYSNADAADANDDGAANLTDAVYLSQYLFQGGSAPPCPFPNPGRDCTPDSLENCCSPPVGGTDGYGAVGTITESVLDEGTGWDLILKTVTDIGDGRKKIKYDISNLNKCDHVNTGSIFEDVNFPISGPNFTKKQLRNGILNIILNAPVDFAFVLDAPCSAGYGGACDGTNFMLIVANEMSVSVDIGPSNSPTPTETVEYSYEADNYQYTYSRTGQPCHIVPTGNSTPQILFQLGVGSAIADRIVNECESWKIFKVRVSIAEFHFSRSDNPDVMQKEKITMTLFPQVYYDWCVCQ